MNMRDFEQALNLTGEPVTLKNCPAVIPKSQLEEVFDTLKVLGTSYNVIIQDSGMDDVGMIALIDSPNFSCRVERIENGGYFIFVPLGMVARIRVLARLLLRYWECENNIVIRKAPPDRLPREDKPVPELLQPIFSDNPDLNTFWKDIYKLDKRLKDAKPYEEDVRELVHLALVYLISHEFTHIWHRHFKLLEQQHNENAKLSRDDILRGLELDADDGAARVAMLIMHELVDQYHKAGRELDLSLGWLRFSYVTTMIYGIFDAQRPHLSTYDKGSYNHPVVRREAFFGTMLSCVEASKDEKEMLQYAEYEGWKRCIFAFNSITQEAIKGMYGDYPEGFFLSTLEMLLHEPPHGKETDAEKALIREAAILKYKVSELIKPFYENES